MIEIVTACDDKYVQHLGVMLCSLLENTSQKEKIKIHVIDGGITDKNKNILSNFFNNKYLVKIKYLVIDTQLYSRFKISYHFTHTIYYRISIPLLLPSEIKKVLYLDSDLILKDDISKLWSIELKDNFLAAVELINANKKHLKGIIPDSFPYFNSGVLLMDLDKWRENNISSKVIQFIQDYQDKIIWWDQDSLNAVLYDKWLPLPLKWNQQTNFFDINIKNTSKKNEIEESIKNPSIIHYTGLHKPWEYIDNHPYKYEYYNYILLTPWSTFKPQKNVILFIEKMIRIYTPSPILLVIKFLFHKLLSFIEK